MTDFLDEKRKEITDRLGELKPLVDEYQRLEAAASALAGVGGSASSTGATPRRRGPGRPRGSVSRTSAKATAATATAAAPAKAGRKKPGRPPGRKKPGRPAGSSSSSSSTPRRAGRRKGSGTRAAEALAFVTGQPGITIPELAAKMGIKQNYLYRVLPSLEQEGKVAKQGRGWHPKS